MSNWNGRISGAVSTVAMPTSRSSGRPPNRGGRRTTATRDEFRRGRRTAATRRTIKGDTLSESPLRVNAVHHTPTNPANSGGTSLARRELRALLTDQLVDGTVQRSDE